MVDSINFLIYPAINQDHHFPAEVRAGIAEAPELAAIYANKTTFNSHTANKSNPHAVTKSQVGLSMVDNTSDLDKPISNATASAISIVSSTANEALTLAQSGTSEGTILDGGTP